MDALRCAGLGKRFDRRWALRGLDLAAGPGEVVALLGPNGSGKSTLLRLAATLLAPSEGTVRIAGLDPAEDGAAARARLGFAGDTPRLYADLTVAENVGFAAQFFPGGPARVAPLLDAVGLAGVAQDRARSLSRGQAMRACIARALVGEPALLLLDEPFASLDAAAHEAVQGLLARAAAQGTAVLFSAQSLDPAPAACRRFVALEAGRVRLDARGGLAELRARWGDVQGGKA